jgi:hypothetical protein
MSEGKMSYYCVIPAKIMHDKKLNATAKLLYGEIAGLANDKGYCWASNGYFEERFECSDRTIINLLNSLIEQDYIKKEFIFSKENPNQVLERRLYINDSFIPILKQKKFHQGG